MKKPELLKYALARKKEGYSIVIVTENSKAGTANRDASESEIEKHVSSGGNLGTIPPEHICIIDVDRHGDIDGLKSLKELQTKLRLNLKVSVYSPNDGRHIFVFVPPEYRQTLRSRGNFLPGLDLMFKNRYTVTPFSEINGKSYILADSGFTVNRINNKEFWKILNDSTVSTKETATLGWTPGNRQNNLVRLTWKIVSTENDLEKRDEKLELLKKEALENGYDDGEKEIDRCFQTAIDKRGKEDIELLKQAGLEPDSKPFFDTDIAAACHRFFHTFRANIVFVKHSSEYDLLVWDENKWTYDPEKCYELIWRNELSISQAFVQRDWLALSVQKRYSNRLLDQRKLKTIYESLFIVYRGLRKTDNLPEELKEIDFSQVNNDKDWLVFQSSAVNLKTGKEIPINESKTFYSTIALDFPYQKEPNCEIVEKLLVGKYDLFRAIAKSLFGGADRNLIVAIGNTGTGKTTFLEILNRALGDYACISQLEFLSRDNKPDSHDTSLVAILKGQRLVFGSDVADFNKFSPANIKRYVGSDVIVAREIREATREWQANYTIVFSENEIPYTGIFRHEAVADRVKFIQCDPFGVENELTKEEVYALKTDRTCYQSLLANLVEFCVYPNERFPDQTSFLIEAIESEYPDYFLNIKQHIDFVKSDDPELFVTTDEVWSRVKEYVGDAKRRSVIIILQRYIKRELEIVSTRSSDGKKRGWLGLDLVRRSVDF